MNDYEVKNAKIASTRLGVAWTDHGFLSFAIDLEGAGWAQAYGTFPLDDASPGAKAGNYAKPTRVPTILAASLLLAVHEVWGTDWEKLPGLPCRAMMSFGQSMRAVGHYLKDSWLWLDEEKMEFVVTDFKAIKPRKERP